MEILTSLTEITPPNVGEYMWKFDALNQKDGQNEGKVVTILGGVHGNEHAGLYVIHELLKLAADGKIIGGSLQLAVGNPKAVELNQRFTEVDLNRCFGENPKPSYEADRAQELKVFLDETDVLVDIHATIKPSEPFLTVPGFLKGAGGDADIVSKLGVSDVYVGKGLLPPSGDPIYTDGYVGANKRGGLGITLEAGWQQDLSLVGKTIEGVKKLLIHCGVLDPSCLPQETVEAADSELITYLTLHETYKNVVATPGFKFVKEYENMEMIPKGTVYATDSSGKEFITDQDSCILFPKPPEKIVVEQEACILVKQ